MNLLLDTHAFLWLMEAPEKIPAKALRGLRKSRQQVAIEFSEHMGNADQDRAGQIAIVTADIAMSKYKVNVTW